MFNLICSTFKKRQFFDHLFFDTTFFTLKKRQLFTHSFFYLTLKRYTVASSESTITPNSSFKNSISQNSPQDGELHDLKRDFLKTFIKVEKCFLLL